MSLKTNGTRSPSGKTHNHYCETNTGDEQRGRTQTNTLPHLDLSLFSVLCSLLSLSLLPSSAVGDLDQGGEEGWISVHIRIIPGGWTENTLRYFCAMNGRDLNEDDLKNDLFLSLTSRDAKGKT